jgi:hypothetical protein
MERDNSLLFHVISNDQHYLRKIGENNNFTIINVMYV